MKRAAPLIRILPALLALLLQSLAPAAMAQRAAFLPPGAVLCDEERRPPGFLDLLHGDCALCLAVQTGAPPPPILSGLVRLETRRLRRTRPLDFASRRSALRRTRWARAPPPVF